MFARIRFACLALCAIGWSCALAPPAAAQCPAKTTVADTLYNADGSLASGRVTIAWPTFLIGSCQVISGQTTVTVLNGALSVQLYPNTSATPAGTSFRATFALKSGRITTEYWVVPTSATPVALAAVRSPSVPVPAVMFAEAQVTNLVADLAKKLELPSPCPAGKVLESNGSSTPPQLNCVDPLSSAGAQHQVNGVNLVSNSPVNFQDSTSIAFANPGAGNVQATVADGAVTAAKLAVSSPSAVQLVGIGDNNIAPAALSPNRILGTAVAQARAISTTSPITGGGDLSANRTIACPTCVTSISGTANEISATGGTAPTLSLPSIVDLSSKTLKGSTPLVLDGATADSNKTTVVVTDSTAARNFTLPNADSVAVQPATCSGTDKVSSISTLGVITCSADQSGGGSNHNLLSATHTDTAAGSPLLGNMIYANSTPAWTKLAGNSTTTKQYLAQTGTGSASAAPVWSQPAFSELSGSATAGQLPNLENHNGTLTPAKGGTGANNAATTGRYPRGDGTNFVTSSVAAAGAGSCTNQFVRATVDEAAPTCASVAAGDFANQNANVVLAGPISGAAAAPAFRALDAADTEPIDLHRFNVKPCFLMTTRGGSAISFVNEDNSAPTGTVSHVVPTDTEPYIFNVASGATSGNAASIDGGNLRIRWDNDANQRRNPYFYVRAGIQETTSTRFWTGLTDQVVATMVASDNPAGNYAAFRFSTVASDTNWKCITKDNTTQNVQDSGVAPSAGVSVKFEITVDNSVPNVTFKINGASVCGSPVTANLPLNNTNMRWEIGLATQTTAARNLRWRDLFVQTDF